MSPECHFYRFLEHFRHGDSITSPDSLLQCLTTLSAKNFFPISNLILSWCNLMSFPVTHSVASMVAQAPDYKSVLTVHENGFQLLIWTNVISGPRMMVIMEWMIRIWKALETICRESRIHKTRKQCILIRYGLFLFFIFFFLLNTFMKISKPQS